jgi:aldose 1-epimerase
MTARPASPASHRAERTSIDGLPAIAVHDEAGDLCATYVPEAGMLAASLVHRGEELLWTGAGARAYARERTFMGIPFLHPWANRLDRAVDSPLVMHDEHGLPIHGTLTASPWWRVMATEPVLHAALSYDRPELLAVFPYPHRVELRVQAGGGALDVTTTIVPTADRAVPAAFGFHPYLRIPGLPREEWQLSVPAARRLCHDERLIPTGATQPAEAVRGPVGARTSDDGFDRLAVPRRLTIRGGGREVAVELGEGYPVAQIFVPPGEEYVCLEPMTAAANALVADPGGLTWVEPGRQHSASFRITVRDS